MPDNSELNNIVLKFHYYKPREQYKDGDESDYLSKVTHYDPNGNITGISDYSDRQITDIFPH